MWLISANPVSISDDQITALKEHAMKMSKDAGNYRVTKKLGERLVTTFLAQHDITEDKVKEYGMQEMKYIKDAQKLSEEVLKRTRSLDMKLRAAATAHNDVIQDYHKKEGIIT